MSTLRIVIVAALPLVMAACKSDPPPAETLLQAKGTEPVAPASPGDASVATPAAKKAQPKKPTVTQYEGVRGETKDVEHAKEMPIQ
jgi:hypothetical protein